MEFVLNGSVTHPIINEKIDDLVECDKIYVRFMESRLKIQEELEFLHRLHNFHNQFSINRKLYIQFRLFREECEEISDKISKVEKQLEAYQKKFEETFTRMVKNSIRRSATLQLLKAMIANNYSGSDPNILTSSVTLMPTNKALLSEKETLEEDWAIFSEYANQEIMACHSQFYILCKEFSM